jgi:hypothetical protein
VAKNEVGNMTIVGYGDRRVDVVHDEWDWRSTVVSPVCDASVSQSTIAVLIDVQDLALSLASDLRPSPLLLQATTSLHFSKQNDFDNESSRQRHCRSLRDLYGKYPARNHTGLRI